MTFTEELTDCNRLALPTETCTIPVNTLKTTPFEIDWGKGIYAKVVAINAYGPSAISDEGNGAVIITYPDAPITLEEDYSKRTATSVMLTWFEGVDNGGSTVIDYQIVYDNTTTTDFVLFESNILASNFDCMYLTSGETYIFKV